METHVTGRTFEGDGVLMRFLKAVPDLGPCEGRWVTAFATRRRCSNRASESFDSPCGHLHQLCATCAYALEHGMGTWDEVEDLLEFGMPSGHASLSGSVGANVRGAPWPPANLDPHARRMPAVPRRSAERVPLHVAFAGIGALAALLVVGLPGLTVTGPIALSTALLLYGLALRHA